MRWLDDDYATIGAAVTDVAGFGQLLIGGGEGAGVILALIAWSSAAIGTVVPEASISGIEKVRHFGHALAARSKAAFNS